jgi:hypothetical protein
MTAILLAGAARADVISTTPSPFCPPGQICLPVFGPDIFSGQSIAFRFLADRHYIDSIVRAVNPKPGDRLVEIGPGQGAITLPLLRQHPELTVIEFDRDLIAPLTAAAAPLGALTIIQSDVLRVDFTALAQTEAAMEIFRDQGSGHLVMISSMSAVRGMPKNLTTYAATKAGVAHLAEGLRAELHGGPIKVTVLYPGYIASEMNERVDPTKVKGMVSTEKGVRAMVDAIEKEKDSACVPPLPWAPTSVVMKHAPLGVLKRMM